MTRCWRAAEPGHSPPSHARPLSHPLPALSSSLGLSPRAEEGTSKATGWLQLETSAPSAPSAPAETLRVLLMARAALAQKPKPHLFPKSHPGQENTTPRPGAQIYSRAPPPAPCPSELCLLGSEAEQSQQGQSPKRAPRQRGRHLPGFHAGILAPRRTRSVALESRAWPRSSRGSPRSRSHSFWLPPARRRLLHKARSCSQPWLWAALLPTPQHPKIWGNSPSARLPCLPVLRAVTEGKEHPAPNPKKPPWDGDGREQACFWGGGRDHAFPQALKQMFGGKASSGRRQEVLGARDTHEPARCKHTSGAGGSACAGFPAALQQNFGWAQLQARREEASCVCPCSVGSPKTPPPSKYLRSIYRCAQKQSGDSWAAVRTCFVRRISSEQKAHCEAFGA